MTSSSYLVEINNTNLIKNMVHADKGFSIVSKSTLTPYDLEKLEVTNLDITRYFYLVIHKISILIRSLMKLSKFDFMNFDLCIIYSKFNACSNDNLFKKDKLSIYNIHNLSFKLLAISVKNIRMTHCN